MKKVLIITQNFYPEIGSAANRITNIYNELKDKGYDVTILTTEPSYPNRNLYKDTDFWNDQGQMNDVVRIHTNTRRYTSSIFNRLLLYLEVALKFILKIKKMNTKYDFVFVSTPPIFVGLAGLFAKHKFSSKLILDVRDLWPESLLGVGVFTNKFVLKLAFALEMFLYKKADHIIVNSEGFISYIAAKGIHKKRIQFMPNSLTEAELNSSLLQGANDKIEVIYTGNIGLAQDISKLIEVAELLKSYTFIRFKVIGYGYKRSELKQLIEEKGLQNIVFLKALNRKNALKEVASSHIAYVSLVEETVFKKVLPGKIIDYMSMGKPIVGDVSGYAKEVIEKAQCGLTSNDRSVEILAQQIVKLANDAVLREEYGRNGHRFAFENLRWKKNINVLINMLEERNESESMHVRMEPLHK
ncbi:glycosyltransferase WbuB [Fictibacillus phosphorivorans]|uniref:Glycosyltransferase WbuB n=1 Tax=Fictibacillus phosphorivorans TaxID=1221500 RepID=A0A163PSK7_9BACL|nr:glycosyltransferase family 4 protein [Fictibacillus phosphorivorans]KZE64063.1 glycosyltransferase WbuB [Fictibacillus phosphorivorans]